MLFKIKNRLEKELVIFGKKLDKDYSLKKISPLLFKHIEEFILRKGKRVRPLLFIIGYTGFSEKRPAGLYTSALSMELLHDFMLVHDDIIDKSDTRRGRPSMHKMFNDYLRNKDRVKFSGQDLAIVAGDVMYAMGINAFLAINEEKGRKEEALAQLNKAALFTGCGEFIELVYGTTGIEQMSKEEVYKIYDYKTAYYTFASPLAIGAILAGAGKKESDTLLKYGLLLGRAFQIKDDCIGLFSEEEEIGKSTLTDLQEAKKTILIWHAYNHSAPHQKKKMKLILSKDKAGKSDLAAMQEIVARSGAFDYAKKEIQRFIGEADRFIELSKISVRSKEFLREYSKELLKL